MEVGTSHINAMMHKPPFQGLGVGLKRSTGVSSKNRPICHCCGEVGHIRPECKFKLYQCRSCKKSGHLTKVCKNQSASGVNMMMENDIESTVEQKNLHLNSLLCLNVDKVKFSDPIYITLNVNNISLKFLVDTGSPISAMSVSLAKKYFDLSLDKLLPSNVKLKVYNNQWIKPVGVIKVLVNTSLTLDLFIFKDQDCGPVLVGRDWLIQLGILNKDLTINNIFNVFRNIPEHTLDQQIMEKKIPQVFSDILGTYSSKEVNLT